VFTEYLRELQKVALLPPDEEARLWTAYKCRGNVRSRAQLIEAYQPLVFKVAMRLRPEDAIAMDMIQEGTVGLIEAVERFDPARGVRFSTFAAYRIRGQILNALRRERSAAGALAAFAAHPEESPVEHVPDMAAADRLAAVEDAVLLRQIAAAIDRLPEKERRVLRASFFQADGPQRAASELRISLSHFYRLQKQALSRIKGSLAASSAGLVAQREG
jgi:RNA polymerase sporulation-specific sigma factor